MEKFFKLREHHTDVKTEVIAGITTFMAMAYILAVNPNILSATGMPAGSVFTATAVASAVATILMGVIANLPFALSAGMGLNAYFAYTVCLGMGASWQFALAAVFVEGLIFIILSLTNVREAIFNSIPMSLKTGVSAGIGLFILIIALINANILQPSAATTVSLVPFAAARNGVLDLVDMQVATSLLCLTGVIIIGILIEKNVKGNILIGILITWILGMLCQVIGLYKPGSVVNGAYVVGDFSGEHAFYSLIPSGFISMPESMAPTFMAFKQGFGEISTRGVVNFIVVLISFLFVDVFDTLGTLIGCASSGNMLDEKGQLPGIKGALLSDAIGTTFGAIVGTSTITTFVESASGVEEGGRTGLTAITTAALFLLALFFWPIFSVIPSFATSSALIVVGFLMMKNVAKIQWNDVTEALPAFLAIIAMPFFYSISEGISFGIISYCLLNLLTGKVKKLNPVLIIVAVLFVLKYIFV